MLEKVYFFLHAQISYTITEVLVTKSTAKIEVLFF